MFHKSFVLFEESRISEPLPDVFQDAANPSLGDGLTTYLLFSWPRACFALGGGILLSPAAGALLMSLSTVIVAVNARTLRM
jgi:hypothetical protein